MDEIGSGGIVLAVREPELDCVGFELAAEDVGPLARPKYRALPWKVKRLDGGIRYLWWMTLLAVA